MTNQSDIKKLAEQMASSMKSFDDIKDFQKQLMQSFIDTALEAEMEEHLGYPKHEKADRPNKRNGHTKKRVRSDTGELEISTPRDRDSSFEPVLVSKHQTRISGLDDKIISFYAKGQTTTEIVETIKDIYDVDISSSLVSRVTDNILDDITAWQNRPLSSVYPNIFFNREQVLRACPYLDNEAKNRLNRQQNKANCADNIGILSNNLTQFCQI